MIVTPNYVYWVLQKPKNSTLPNLKLKKANVSTAKCKVKRLKPSPNKNSRTSKKSSIQVEEASQLLTTIQDESIGTLSF